MQTENTETLKNFDINNLPNLDVAVLGALELFEQRTLPKIDISNCKRPLVVGSGNGEITGRIVFEKTDAVFASESNYEEKLKNIPAIDEVVIVSASGKKHAPVIAKYARDMGKRVTLITNTPNSPTAAELDGYEGYREFVLPKNREPYTYNVSTYMGMILGMTGENPTAIKRFIIDVVGKLNFPDFTKYNKYYLLVPSHLSNIAPMLTAKFIELFGRNIARDIQTVEYATRHATTVVPSDELFISFGEPNENLGDPEHRFHVPLPEDCDYGAMMAIGYYVVSQIQAAYPYYFKDNIVKYTADVSRQIGQTIEPIVE